MPSQDSLTDQMRRTVSRAVHAGDYDAADWIRARWDGSAGRDLAGDTEPPRPLITEAPDGSAEYHPPPYCHSCGGLDFHSAGCPEARSRPTADELAEAAGQHAKQRGRELAEQLRREQQERWDRLPQDAKDRIDTRPLSRPEDRLGRDDKPASG